MSDKVGVQEGDGMLAPWARPLTPLSFPDVTKPLRCPCATTHNQYSLQLVKHPPFQGMKCISKPLAAENASILHIPTWISRPRLVCAKPSRTPRTTGRRLAFVGYEVFNEAGFGSLAEGGIGMILRGAGMGHTPRPRFGAYMMTSGN